MLTPGADPVRKVSIIPRGRALGVTFSSPDFDRVNYDRTALTARLDVAYAGRVAEELVLDDISIGAENDIEQVTQLARSMVGRWGMSDRVGFLAVIPRDGSSPFARSPWSESTAEALDAEVRRLVDAAHDRVERLLIKHRDQLEALALALLEHETLDQDAAYAAAGITPDAQAIVSR
jgi:cell division protease FtsH